MADSADVKEEVAHNYKCRLCEENFKENIPIACEHLIFCRSCLKKYYLSDSMVPVCTWCSKISGIRNEQQDILSLMHLHAKYRSGNCRNLAVHLLCEKLNEVLNLSGTTPCPKTCYTCPMVTLTNEESRALTGPDGNIEFGPYGNKVIGPNGELENVKGNFTCKSTNVIYFIYCKREGCRQAYVGQTTKRLQVRMTKHRSKINNNKGTTLISKHFSLANGHTVADCKVCVIKEFPSDTEDLKTVMANEEDRLIKLLGTKAPNGLNKYKG